MSIKVLLADDTDLMRHAIRKLIKEEPSIELVGEASNFGQAVQLIADFRPEVLLLDLHLAEKREFTPALVESQLSSVENVLAVSFSNDAEAEALAESYGAKLLLDKMKLFNQLIPAILKCSALRRYARA
jgi:two-component system invasion response regulator UvrY